MKISSKNTFACTTKASDGLRTSAAMSLLRCSIALLWVTRSVSRASDGMTFLLKDVTHKLVALLDEALNK